MVSLALLILPSFSHITIANGLSFTSIKDTTGSILVNKENETIISIIPYENNQSFEHILVAYMHHFESYLVDRINFSLTLESNESWGLNQNIFVWSVREYQQNFVVSLSNGTIFSFNLKGLNWSFTFSNAAISNIERLSNDYFVAISDLGEIIWFYPSNGSLINNFIIPNTYFTISKSYGNYFIAGNNNGSIFVFNSLISLYNKTVGPVNSQVISLAINQNYFSAFSLNGSVESFNLENGALLNSNQITGVDYNSLFLMQSNLYITKIDGSFNIFSLSSNSIVQSNPNLYINNLLDGDFTGDGINNTIGLSNLGYVYAFEQNTTNVVYNLQISQSTITTGSALNINGDTITDLAIGTRNGEFYIISGPDITPPSIITNSVKYNSTDTELTLFFSTSEPVTASITYSELNQINPLNINNATLTTSKLITISNLKPDTVYHLIVNIKDKAGNQAEPFSIDIITEPSPPPYDLYLIGGTIAVMGLVGVIYFIQRSRLRTKAFKEGELYYEAGEYILAIKAYMRANAREKIIDIVSFLASNPQLSSFVDEIRQMEELNAYMVDIQEIIKNQT